MCGPWSAKGLAVGNKLSLLTQKITLCWGYNLLTLRGFTAQSYSQLFPHSYSHPLHSLIRKPFKCYLVARTKQLSFASCPLACSFISSFSTLSHYVPSSYLLFLFAKLFKQLQRGRDHYAHENSTLQNASVRSYCLSLSRHFIPPRFRFAFTSLPCAPLKTEPIASCRS